MIWFGVVILVVVSISGWFKFQRQQRREQQRSERQRLEAQFFGDTFSDTVAGAGAVSHAPTETHPDRLGLETESASLDTADQALATIANSSLSSAEMLRSGGQSDHLATTTREESERTRPTPSQPEPQPRPQRERELTPEPARSNVVASTDPAKLANEYAFLSDLLDDGQYEEADRVTWRILLQLLHREDERFVNIDDVFCLPAAELWHLDRLWRDRSGGKFGFSVQCELFHECEDDCSQLGATVKWVVNGEWLSPENAIYNLENAPKGHLPQEFWRNTFLVNGAWGVSLLLICLSEHESLQTLESTSTTSAAP